MFFRTKYVMIRIDSSQRSCLCGKMTSCEDKLIMSFGWHHCEWYKRWGGKGITS